MILTFLELLFPALSSPASYTLISHLPPPVLPLIRRFKAEVQNRPYHLNVIKKNWEIIYGQVGDLTKL